MIFLQSWKTKSGMESLDTWLGSFVSSACCMGTRGDLWLCLTDSARRYLLSRDETEICEVLKFSDEPRSWFIGNSVQRGTS